MIDSDKAAFLRAIARLAVALREREPDVLMMRTYFETLKVVEIEFICMAAIQLEQTSAWFPRTSEWLALATKIEAARVAEQRALLRKLPAPLCALCDDSGWRRDASDRVRRCDCQTARRLEVLGRRPWPALPEAPLPVIDAEIGRNDTASLTALIQQKTGLTLRPRGMPPLSAPERAAIEDDRVK